MRPPDGAAKGPERIRRPVASAFAGVVQRRPHKPRGDVMLFGTNLRQTSAFNYRIVMETVRLHGPISRAEIARRCELTAQTISNIVRRLMAAGLIDEAERRQAGRGAPSTLLQVNPNGAYAIGLDLDQDHLTTVLVDLSGVVRQRIRLRLDFPPPDEAVAHMVSVIRRLLEQHGLTEAEVWGVGVGFPGPLGIMDDSIVVNAVNPTAFPGWKNVPIVDRIRREIDVPVFLENNATAAAMGEFWYGEGRHIATFFYVFLGLGLGGGLIIDGQPFEGYTGNAGEIGYLPACRPAPDSAEAGRLHLGVSFNLPNLYRLLAAEGIHAASPSDLGPILERHDPTLDRWIDDAVAGLAPALVAVEYLLDPEAVLFGGRWPRVLVRELIGRLQRRLPTLRIEGKQSAPRLVEATSGADAAALGLATLPFYAAFSPSPDILIGRNGTSPRETVPRRIVKRQTP